MKRRKAGGGSANPQSAPLVRTSISFPQDLYESLEGIARQKKVSMAWVVRDASERYVAEGGAEAPQPVAGRRNKRTNAAT
jgi:predicted DNA-binding ribbon-helix-helix protein